MESEPEAVLTRRFDVDLAHVRHFGVARILPEESGPGKDPVVVDAQGLRLETVGDDVADYRDDHGARNPGDVEEPEVNADRKNQTHKDQTQIKVEGGLELRGANDQQRRIGERVELPDPGLPDPREDRSQQHIQKERWPAGFRPGERNRSRHSPPTP